MKVKRVTFQQPLNKTVSQHESKSIPIQQHESKTIPYSNTRH